MSASSATTPRVVPRTTPQDVPTRTATRDVPTRTATRDVHEPDDGNSGQGVCTRTARRRDVEPNGGNSGQGAHTRTTPRGVHIEPDDGNRAVVRLDCAIYGITLTNAAAVLSSWFVRNEENTLGLLCYSRPPGTRSYPTNSDFAVYVVLTAVSTLVAIGSAFSLCLSSRTNNSRGEPPPDIESGRPADQAVPTPIVFGIPVTDRGSQPTGSSKAGSSQDTQ